MCGCPITQSLLAVLQVHLRSRVAGESDPTPICGVGTRTANGCVQALDRDVEGLAQGESEEDRESEQGDVPFEVPAENGNGLVLVPQGDRLDWPALGQRILSGVKELVQKPRF